MSEEIKVDIVMALFTARLNFGVIGRVTKLWKDSDENSLVRMAPAYFTKDWFEPVQLAMVGGNRSIFNFLCGETPTPESRSYAVFQNAGSERQVVLDIPRIEFNMPKGEVEALNSISVLDINKITNPPIAEMLFRFQKGKDVDLYLWKDEKEWPTEKKAKKRKKTKSTAGLTPDAKAAAKEAAAWDRKVEVLKKRLVSNVQWLGEKL